MVWLNSPLRLGICAERDADTDGQGHGEYFFHNSCLFSVCDILQAYMRGADCRYIPCQYTHNPNAITIVGRTQPEILALWQSGEAIAVFCGLPELNEIVYNGTILFTNSMVAKWGGTTFNGLLASTRFLDRLDPKYADYNVRTFMEQIIQELAKVFNLSSINIVPYLFIGLAGKFLLCEQFEGV